jgi:L-fuconolactonase
MSHEPQAVIDAHQHFWDPATAEYPWMTGAYLPLRRRYGPEHLEREHSSAGVDFTVVVQARHDLDETRRLLDIARTTSWVVGVVGWVDLTTPKVGETLMELGSLPAGDRLVGIRHQVHDESDPDWLLRPEVLRGLSAVADAGLAYDLLVRSRELPAALTVAQRLPGLRLVLDHIAKPPIRTGEIEPWASLLAGFRSVENVTCKVSGLVTEANWCGWKPDDFTPYVSKALDVFGPHRLMFGSDWPVCLLAATYLEVLETTVDVLRTLIGTDLNSILGQCATRAYALDARSGAST